MARYVSVVHTDIFKGSYHTDVQTVATTSVCEACDTRILIFIILIISDNPVISAKDGTTTRYHSLRILATLQTLLTINTFIA
jgi:hypothetical protein